MQYYRDKIFLDTNGVIADLPADNHKIASFKFATKIAGKIGNNGEKIVRITVSLKYLTNFWRAPEMSLINCEINLIPTWSANCFIVDAPVEN